MSNIQANCQERLEDIQKFVDEISEKLMEADPLAGNTGERMDR